METKRVLLTEEDVESGRPWHRQNRRDAAMEARKLRKAGLHMEATAVLKEAGFRVEEPRLLGGLSQADKAELVKLRKLVTAQAAKIEELGDVSKRLAALERATHAQKPDTHAK